MGKEAFDDSHGHLVESLLKNNETKSNMQMLFFLGVLWFVLVLILLFTHLEIFWLDFDIYLKFFICATLVFIPPFALCKRNKEKSWFKYFVMFVVLLTIGGIDSYLGYNLKLFLAVPVIISVRYFSKKMTLNITIASFIVFTLSSFFNAMIGEIDLNMLDLTRAISVAPGDDIRTIILDNAAADRNTLILTQMIFGLLPESLVLLMIAVICYKVADRGLQMIHEQASVSLKTSRLETELNLASNIQNGMLPSIFPPFPDCHEFDLFASMTPAKEVGGDFYDFFMIDENHLSLVIADVSGKGIPAALFMMIAKTLLKTQAQNGGTPADILQKVNNQLCNNNPGEMFVTVWFGIYEISTGKLVAANAGHEYPAIRKSNGKFELLKDKHGFVLAGMEGARYKEYEIQMDVGDTLFVYTDGVAEASNENNEQFGTDRMLQALNSDEIATTKELLETVHSRVNDFVGEAEQFDDLTMLSLTRKL